MMSKNFSTATVSLLAFSLSLASCAQKIETSQTSQAALREPAARDTVKQPSGDSSPHAIHARALKAQKEGEFAAARLDFMQLAAGGYILEDYAALGLAQTSMTVGNVEGILPILDGVLQRYPETPVREKLDRARLGIACADETAPLCGEYLEKIRKGRVSSGFEPELLYVSAKRREKAGEALEAYKEYQKIYSSHPTSIASEKAEESMRNIEMAANAAGSKIKLPPAGFNLKMDRIEKLESARKFSQAAAELASLLKEAPKHESVRTLYKLGMALKKARDKEGAKRSFERLLEKGGGGPYGGMAAYHMALLEWNDDLGKQAENRLLKALKGNPGKEAAKLSHILLGKIYEAQNSLKSARSRYIKALEMASAGAESAELDWRVCWVEYQMGDFKEAGRRFLEAHKRVPEGERDGAFLYWAVRAFEKAGDKNEAEKARKRLADGFPETYYGASVADISLAGGAAPAGFIPPADTEIGKPPLDEHGTRLLDRRNALIRIGLSEGARLEVAGLSSVIGDDHDALLWLSALYRLTDDIPSSIRTASRAAVKMAKGNKKDYADPAWRALYPAAFWDSVSRESLKNSLNPFITLSLIRQESMFDQRAVSAADARGLMQLLPSTGKATYDLVAKGWGSPAKFEEKSLFDPDTNIRLGAAHLASLVAKYGGNMARSIAAYNAGSIAVDKWIGRFGEVEDDEFVERIPYAETRGYVKKVLRNAALYRRIYGDGGTAAGKAPSIADNGAMAKRTDK